MRLKIRVGIKRHFIFIRIEQFRVRMLQKPLCRLKKRMLFQQIVMVQKNHIVPSCHGKRRVGIAGDSPVFRKLFITHPGILAGIVLHDPLD